MSNGTRRQRAASNGPNLKPPPPPPWENDTWKAKVLSSFISMIRKRRLFVSRLCLIFKAQGGRTWPTSRRHDITKKRWCWLGRLLCDDLSRREITHLNKGTLKAFYLLRLPLIPTHQIFLWQTLEHVFKGAILYPFSDCYFSSCTPVEQRRTINYPKTD